MEITMGPVLSFRGEEDDKWRVSAIFVTDKKNKAVALSVSDPASVSAPEVILAHGSEIVVRYQFEVQQKSHSQQIAYGFDDSLPWSFHVPEKSESPKMAFASCNGFSDFKDMKSVGEKNALWAHLTKLHDAEPYHVLLLGGDQVYADQIWLGPEMEKWRSQSREDRRKHKFTKALKDEVTDFYFTLYRTRWAATFQNSNAEMVSSNPETASAFAAIPTLMMWDDHDIFDGWGSYSPDDQNCPVYKGIFEVAKTHFLAFQQQVNPSTEEERPGTIADQSSYSFGLKIADIGVLALDTRSERTQEQVISLDSWNAIWKWSEGLKAATQGGMKHLFVISPVPVVHADFGSIESLLNFLPGEQELEDDLRDHWQSEPHREERLRMIHRLFGLMDNKSIRTSILSGDVHVAALGFVQTTRTGKAGSRAQVINQLTSSGIVHPAPPKLMNFVLEGLSDKPEPVDQGITATIVNFPRKRKKFVLCRNFLSLEPDPQDRIWSNWYLEEDLSQKFTKVINPIT